jgi:pyroglutamyl-peptidase
VVFAVKVLLTGFSSFPGVPKNPCEWVLENVSKQVHDGSVQPLLLPVSFERSIQELDQAINCFQPNYIVELGVASSSTVVRLETVAYNTRSASIPDVDGVESTLAPLDDAFPLGGELCTTLDITACKRELAESGFHDVKTSLDPGRYVCNSLYWHTLQKHKDIPSVFVHIPMLNTQNQDEVLRIVLQVLTWAIKQK